MTHLPFIAGAYGIGIVLTLWLAVGAHLRLRTARRRLAAVDTRRRAAAGSPPETAPSLS